MKTQELIKQAEKLLKVHDTAFTNERDMVIIATFSRNHMQEIVHKLKRYEDALRYFNEVMDTIEKEELKDGDCVENILLNYAIYSEARAKARKALEEA